MMYKLFLTAEKTHSLDVSTVLGDSLIIFIAFVILLLILKKFAIGPAMAMVIKRQNMINDQINEAQLLNEEAQQHERLAKETIVKAQDKAQKLVIKAKETGEKIKEDAEKTARQDVIQIRQQAQKAMEDEREAMLAELTNQVADMSVELAKKILKREISEQDHQRLIEDFIEGLE